MTDMELNFGEPIPKLEEASYAATCRGIEPFLIKENTPDQKTLLRWDFSFDGIEDGDFPGTEVVLDGVTSLATGPKSKMRAWIIALTGSAPADTISLNALRAACVGAPCTAGVVIKAGYSKVETVTRAIKRPAAAPAPAPVAAPGESIAKAESGFSGAPAPQKVADDDLDQLPF